ncbi:response regulator [Heliobacillus mobilis]|uniref:Stage 0 sporulation protein A homolog n=1 Tax=Heliobacterium mobile TaxID=28064 RepID=A0A6I3SHH0_HELMO|nr:response regulator [Heliobacterium mobile]MTV48291.1 response regulator [Heliobacterium mobile]
MNILIVDDEPDSLLEIGAYLNKFGRFDTYELCSNPLEALEKAKQSPFQVALLDIEMPEMNGLDLAEKLLALYPQIGVAFITAYNHYATEAFEVNAIDYILKPIREERLFKALDKMKAKLDEFHVPKEDIPVVPVNRDTLTITMFGKFAIRMGDHLIKWNRQKAAELFAYLLDKKEQPVHKEKLCELLWPDSDPQKALVNLQTSIHAIRKTFLIRYADHLSIEYSGNSYMLRLKDVIIDVEQFEDLIKKAEESHDRAFLEQAVSLYGGDYLEEDGWHWAEAKKVWLQRKYLAAVQELKRNKKSS